MKSSGAEAERYTPTKSQAPLKRGKACLTCRYLKIRCDGEKPICGPCFRQPKEDPCEYKEDSGRSRTKHLEEEIVRLSSRVKELENPELATPSVTLHDPYAVRTNERDSLQLVLQPPLPSADTLSPSSPFSATSNLSNTSSPSGTCSILRARRALYLPPDSGYASTTISPLSDAKPLQPDFEDSGFVMSRHQLDRFFGSASDYGFFLNHGRIYDSVLLPQSPTNNRSSRASPGLVTTMRLWDAHLFPADYGPAQEQSLMLRALADTAINLHVEHPKKVLQTIQSEVLLAYYFFRIGRCLEARYHANGAATLVLRCGLHKLRTSDTSWDASPISVLPNGPVYIPEAVDTIEEGERINGFWTVVILCKNLEVTFERPANVCGMFEIPGLQIDTPWPLDMLSYKEGYLPPQGRMTVNNFLSGVKTEFGDSESSMLALVAKGSVLLHRATYFLGQYSPNFTQERLQAFLSTFDMFNHILNTFQSTLPPLMHLDPSNPSTKSITLAHALVYAATLKLHSIFPPTQGSRKEYLTAAQAVMIIATTHIPNYGSVNPIIGTIIQMACQAFIDELRIVRSASIGASTWSAVQGPASDSIMAEQELLNNLRSGLSILNRLGAESVLTRYQCTQVQEVFSTLMI